MDCDAQHDEPNTPSPEKVQTDGIKIAQQALFRDADWVSVDLGEARPSARTLQSDYKNEVITHVTGTPDRVRSAQRFTSSPFAALLDDEDEHGTSTDLAAQVRSSIEADLLRAPSAVLLAETSTTARRDAGQDDIGIDDIPSSLEEIHALAQKSRSKGKGRKRKAEEERPTAATETVDSALQFIKQELNWPMTETEAPEGAKKRRKKPRQADA
jgi:hypothetical protein